MIELLAKSRPRHGGEPLSLLQHSCDAEQAAAALFRPGSRWNRTICRFFGITSQGEAERWLLNLRVAALFHDIGKANEDFQRALSGAPGSVQTVRHEHLSGLLLCLDTVRAWLAKNPALDIDGITAAVISHHLKATDAPHPDYGWCEPRGGRSMLTLHLDHPQVAAILERIRAVAELPPVPALPPERWSTRPPWQKARQRGLRRARDLRHGLPADPRRRGFLLALKAGVIAADSVASAMVRTGQSIPEWIDQVAHAPAISGSAVRTAIIDQRCQQVERSSGRPFTFHTFQERAAGLGRRALLLAGCGSGKTLAAWRWAAAQLDAHELGHVVFLYPTRGTATEGFRDYVAWAPETEGALVHGTAGYELAGMQQNPGDAGRGKDHALSEADARLFALGLWRRRYFSATVDQLLSFMEHRYQSLCLLPLLADSAVILDEIHSYDRSMFDNLVAFLGAFDVPVLCMTATLPPARRHALEALGLRVYPEPADRIELADLEAAEQHPRYRIHEVAGADDAYRLALDAYRQGRRVLWVVNTVRRCQLHARRLHDELGQPVLAYHSRYRLRDRQDKHAATVAAFQQRGTAALAVTTQVCEMSLDLDADVLITELAPIPSLVQRLGRANRHARPGDTGRADVYLYDPGEILPYTPADFDATRAFLADIGSGDISQRTLAEALERHARPEPMSDGSARFLDSGYFAVPGSFRDESDNAMSCVLDSDLAHLARHAGDHRALDDALPGYILAVPKGAVPRPPAWDEHAEQPARPAWLPRYLGIAPAERYTPDLGFLTGTAGDR